MATYTGKAGIAQLKANLELKAKTLMGETIQQVTTLLVDESPVGADNYRSKQGLVANARGDFKNSWVVGLGEKNNTTRHADTTGAGAIAGAMIARRTYNMQELVYITNNLPYANNVEKGWDDNPIYGWKAKDGYGVVQHTQTMIPLILTSIATKVKTL